MGSILGWVQNAPLHWVMIFLLSVAVLLLLLGIAGVMLWVVVRKHKAVQVRNIFLRFFVVFAGLFASFLLAMWIDLHNIVVHDLDISLIVVTERLLDLGMFCLCLFTVLQFLRVLDRRGIGRGGRRSYDQGKNHG